MLNDTLTYIHFSDIKSVNKLRRAVVCYRQDNVKQQIRRKLKAMWNKRVKGLEKNMYLKDV